MDEQARQEESLRKYYAREQKAEDQCKVDSERYMKEEFRLPRGPGSRFFGVVREIQNLQGLLRHDPDSLAYQDVMNRLERLQGERRMLIFDMRKDDLCEPKFSGGILREPDNFKDIVPDL